MSTPVKSEESFEAGNGNDLYPDLSSPSYEAAQDSNQAPAQPHPLTEEEKKEMQEELEKVEGEIATLRQVLGAKIRYSSELKRKLGITPLQEMKNDFQLGIKTIKDSGAYQKTSAVAKSAAEKTSTVVAGIGSSVSKKLGDLRNSQTFKSVEGKVESAYATVKAKVSGSKSEGNFEEALSDEKEASENGATAKEEPAPEEKVPL